MEKTVKKILGEQGSLLKVLVIFTTIGAVLAGLKIIIGGQLSKKLLLHSTERNDHWTITNSIVTITSKE